LKLFAEFVTLGQLGKARLHAVANHQHNLIDAVGFFEAPPGVSHHGAAVQFQKQLIDIRSHPGALAGGDD
jgi:hypothetical protein